LNLARVAQEPKQTSEGSPSRSRNGIDCLLLSIWLVSKKYAGHTLVQPAYQTEPESPLRICAPVSVDLFDDTALLRFNHIGPVVAVEIAVFPKHRRITVIIIREGFDLHGIRQSIADPHPGRSRAARGARFGSRGHACGSPRDPGRRTSPCVATTPAPKRSNRPNAVSRR
jgi:hypothetical protein